MVLSANLILNTCQDTQLTFNSYIELMSVINHLLGQGNILLIRKMRTIDHYRRETGIDARFAQFERVTVIKMQNDFRMSQTELFSILYSTFSHITQQRLIGILTGTFRDLEDHRRFGFSASLNNSLQLLHIIEVERWNSVTAFNGTCKHVTRIDKAQIFVINHNTCFNVYVDK